MRTHQPIIIVILLCFFAGLFFSPKLIAQKPNYKFRSIQESDGLINSTVQTIFEDSYGFIWLGTHHGLQRFDGKAFTNYEKTSDTTGLSHNFINGLCEDGSGNIWIATSLGLNTYDRKTDKIHHYKWKGSYAETFDNVAIARVLIDGSDDQVLWLTILDVGLVKLDILSDQVTIYAMDKINGFYVWVQGLIQHPYDDNKLILGRDGIYSFDKKNGVFKELVILEQSGNIPNNLINDFVVDPSDNKLLWCATGDVWGRGKLGGLLRFNLETNESKFFTWENRKNEIPDIHIMQVCFSDKDKLWVGTRNFGALLYDLDQDIFYNYRYNEYDKGSFVTEAAIRSMLLDRSGTMWFGTWGDGVSVLSQALQRFKHYKYIPEADNSLTNNYITGLVEDNDGNIWIGTKFGSLNKFDPIHKSFETYFPEFTKTGSNPNEITYLFYDSHEKLWIGTYADALYHFNPETGVTRHYTKGNTSKEISQRRISAITELTPGQILISTYGGGLNIYEYSTDEFTKYLHDPADSTTIGDNQIWLPFLGNDGNYYFGGNSVAGFIQYNPRTKEFNLPPIDRPFTTFLDVVKSNDGRIFIDAISLGVVEVIVGDTLRVIPLTDKYGNTVRNVESITVDQNNMLWMGTSNGLVKYDFDSKTFTRYDVDDGLQGYLFNRFAGLSSSTGELYFGGKNGVNIFHPDDIELSDYKPPIILKDFSLFQEKVEIGQDSPLEQNISLTSEIELKHYQNDFSIGFAALDYSNPQKISYQYRLVNHNEEWISNGNLGGASYTNMDPGEYTFQVMSTNADGVWSDKIKSVDIIIRPPWWQTTMAYIFYGLIFIIGVIVIDRFQRKRLKEKERAQAREKELAQAREIENAYNELKATQTQLIQSEKMASLGELTAGIAHEIQNPLNFVNNFSEVNSELIDELKEEIEQGDKEEAISIANDIAENESKIIHHGKRADSIVKGMLQHSRTNGNEKVSTDINALADEYLRLSYHGLRAKDKSFNADFKTDFDKKLTMINIVPQEVGRVLLNLINNAFYAVSEKAKQNIDGYKPLVFINTKYFDDKIEIMVKDNGDGIPTSVKDKIFQPFFTTKPTGEGTGLGLSLSYDIITKGHGGSLDVETSEGKGTKFIIRLPV